MLPLMLDVRDRLALVVGGGPVGRRKAHTLLEAGARVRLVCLEPRPAAETEPRLEWVVAAYEESLLDGASLVFAAAPPEVSERVTGDARARGLPVNDAADPGRGDLILPSVARRGSLVVAVSTGGAAPALARTIREHLEGHLDEAFTTWIDLLAELRPILRAHVADAEARRQVLADLCGREWLEVLRRQPREEVRRAMLARAGLGDEPDPSSPG